VGKKRIFFLLSGAIIFLFLTPAVFGQVVINEFSSNSNPEWVELYNVTQEKVDLHGWQIIDGNTNNSDDIQLGGCINGKGLRLFSRGEGWLNNTNGDTIILKNALGQEIDIVAYGKSGIIGIPPSGKSGGRSQDGGNSWIIFDAPTPENENCQLEITPLLTSIPTPTEIVISTPATVKATYQINEVKNEKGEALSSVKIYVDDQYIHHYAPEVLEFGDDYYCDDDKKVACGFGEHVIRLEKNGYQDWEETKEIKVGDAYLVNPVMAFLSSPTPTPTATPVPSLSPTGRISPSPSLAITSLLLSPASSSPLLPFADFALAPKKITSEEEEILEENSGQVLGEEKKEKKNSGWYFGVGAFYLGVSGWRLARRDDNDIMEKLNFEEK